MAVSREETQKRLNLLASGVTKHVPEQSYTVPDRFEECARECPNQTFLIYQGAQISFAVIQPGSTPVIRIPT